MSGRTVKPVDPGVHVCCASAGQCKHDVILKCPGGPPRQLCYWSDFSLHAVFIPVLKYRRVDTSHPSVKNIIPEHIVCCISREIIVLVIDSNRSVHSRSPLKVKPGLIERVVLNQVIFLVPRAVADCGQITWRLATVAQTRTTRPALVCPTYVIDGPSHPSRAVVEDQIGSKERITHTVFKCLS